MCGLRWWWTGGAPIRETTFLQKRGCHCPYLRELSAALRDLGLVEARNVSWDVRGVTHDPQLALLATELVARQPDIIVAWGSVAAARAAGAATPRIPVVMIAVPDPVVLNTTTAKGLNLDIPRRVRIRADEIVD